MRKRNWDTRRLFWLIAVLVSGLALVGAVSAQEPVAATATPVPEAVTNSVVDTAANAANAITGTALNLWDQITQTPQSDLARIVLVIGGVVLLVAGWYVYEWVILIAGFLIGGTVALGLVTSTDALLGLVIFLVGGVIGAGLGVVLYYIAVFLIGGYVGIAITEAVAVALNLIPVTLLAVIAGFIVGGLVLMVLSMELLVVLSAVVGAQMIALALNLGVGWVLLLALIGIILQFTAARSQGVDFRRRPMRRSIWVRS